MLSFIVYAASSANNNAVNNDATTYTNFILQGIIDVMSLASVSIRLCCLVYLCVVFRHWRIGGSGGGPRKVSLQCAFKWLFCTQYGYFTGTNDVYMGTNVHICIQIVPPELTGDLWGLCPRNQHLLPPMRQRLW